MDYLAKMKWILDDFLERLNRDAVKCRIPARKGVRRMIPGLIFHDYPEVFLQTEGSTLFTFPNETMELSSGEMLIVPPELPHGEIIIKPEGLFETLVITPASQYVQCHLSNETRQGIPGLLHYETFQGGEQVILREFSDLMTEKSKLPEPYGSFLLRGLSMSLLSTVRVMLEGTVLSTEGNPLIREVKNIVLSRYHDSSLKVGQLAESLNCTADYLSWLFHRETGMTLNRHINQLRLSRAADLLRNTDYSVSEIAWICGYRSPAYFSRLFSREYDRSPVTFRRSS